MSQGGRPSLGSGLGTLGNVVGQRVHVVLASRWRKNYPPSAPWSQGVVSQPRLIVAANGETVAVGRVVDGDGAIRVEKIVKRSGAAAG